MSSLGVSIPDKETLIRVLAQLICNATGIHEHVGQVSDYVQRPDFVGAKLLSAEYQPYQQGVQEYTQMLILATVTGLKVPRLMDDWSHLCTDWLEVYKTFKQSLMELNLIIRAKNLTRDFPFWTFCPENLEISVSV